MELEGEGICSTTGPFSLPSGQPCAGAHPGFFFRGNVGRRSPVGRRLADRSRQGIAVTLERPVDAVSWAAFQHELPQYLLPQIELLNLGDDGSALDVIRRGTADVDVELYRGVIEVGIAW